MRVPLRVTLWAWLVLNEAVLLPGVLLAGADEILRCRPTYRLGGAEGVITDRSLSSVGHYQPNGRLSRLYTAPTDDESRAKIKNDSDIMKWL